MTDNVVANSSDAGGSTFATDEISDVHYPITKITIGAFDAVGTLLTGDSGAADAGTLRVSVATDDIVSTDWNGTVPPIGAGTEAAALRVTVATDSTGVLTVDGAELTTIAGAVVTDDGAFTAGTGTGTPIMGFFSTDVVDANDVGVLAMDASRRLLVSIEADNAGIGGGTQYDIQDVAGATDTGTVVLAIRDNTLTTLTADDGEYTAFRTNSRGAIYITNDNATNVDVDLDSFDVGQNRPGKRIDDPSGSTDHGIAPMVVRDDALSTLGIADLDYTVIRTNARGAVWTELDSTNAVTVDNGGTFVVQEDGAALTALQVIDNIVHVDDAAFTAATDSGAVLMGFVTSDPVDNGDAGALAMTTARALHVDVQNVTPGSTATDLGKSEDAAFIHASVGVMPLAVRGDTPATTSGANGDYEPIQVSGGALWTSLLPQTANGLSMYRNVDVDETDDEIKGSAGQVYAIYAINLKASVLYLQFYDNASPTVGTTTPDLTFALPTQGDTNGAGFSLNLPHGIAFANAIRVAATTGHSDAGAPGANEVILSVLYK